MQQLNSDPDQQNREQDDIVGSEYRIKITEVVSSSASFPSNPVPPPTYFPKSFPYEVFLSFRGIDTRENFSSHLYDRLTIAGIRTFMDDDELQRGREISAQLMKAIEESRIYIVIFSPNYGSSTWCLNELVQIRKRMLQHRGCLLIPIFYGVQPSDVRHQTGSFGKAFNSTRYKNRVFEKDWTDALRFAANNSGFNLQTQTLGFNSKLITQVVKEVSIDVKPKTIFVCKYPVGLDSRVNDVYSLLKFETKNHVQLIGIWGMGGSGKSVIAKALYNKINQSFDSSCFLSSVRANSLTPNGLVHLQEKLLSMLLMRENVTISSIDEGIEMIRNRLSFKRVLIVLDDTDKLNQVDALAGHRNWFGHGSLIIITTRDQHLLNQVQVDVIHKANELNSEQSLELFCWHCFKTPFPKEKYALVAEEIVSYCCGLPLALEVLGALLFGRTIKQWNSAFSKLQKNPRPEIQKILQISYDGLDYQEKEIFLDIACFFIGNDIEYVTEILNGSDFSSDISIGILVERCLVTVNKNNELRMHDLIREMGREIVFQSFPNDPCKRSRLWSYQDAKDVIMRNMGTEAIEGVNLVSPIETDINLTTKSFRRMHRLRLLQMDNVSIHGSYTHLSKNIRWISWKKCSLEYLPFGLQMKNLVALDMQQSNLRSIWADNKVIETRLMINIFSWVCRFCRRNQIDQFSRHLKILNLSHSKCLKSTPDFRMVPALMTLILEGCTSLLHINASIGSLNKLLVLNLKDCEKITNIPSEICQLRLLRYLNLSGCLNLQELPDNLGDIEHLKEVYADETAVTKLPSSLNRLENLTSLSLRRCVIKDLLPLTSSADRASNLLSLPEESAQVHQHLLRLNLRDCNLSDEDIPNEIGYSLCDLRELDLAGNRLSTLPLSFGRLINLKSLWLDDWSILTSVPDLPPNLQDLMAKNIH